MTNKLTNQTILITGGAGFVGSYVAEEVLKLNPAKIIIVDNFIRGSRNNMSSFISNPLIEFIEGDIRDEKLMEDVLSRSQYVFHLAALRINACAANPVDGFEVMIKSLFNLAELCRKYSIKKIIYSSSASVYGLAQHFPTPETDNPYDNQTFYGGAKLWGEQLLRSYKFSYNLDYVALRYFNVYGPRMDVDGKYTEVMIKWLDCIREKRNPLIYGDGSTSMDFVYVQDVARANIAAMLSDVTDEAFNVGKQRETSLLELLHILLKVNNSELKPEFKSDNTINPVQRRLAATEKAKNKLGFNATVDLEEGLKKLSDWYFNLPTKK